MNENPQEAANVVNLGKGGQKTRHWVPPRRTFFGLFPMGHGHWKYGWSPVGRERTNADYAEWQASGQPSAEPQPAPAATSTAASGAAAPAQVATTPVTNYGVNDTGRTLPFSPVPTMPNYQTTAGASGASGQWAGAGYGAGAPTGDGYGMLSGIFGGKKVQRPGYEAALRERPSDIQALVSMTRQAGFPGFGG